MFLCVHNSQTRMTLLVTLEHKTGQQLSVKCCRTMTVRPHTECLYLSVTGCVV